MLKVLEHGTKNRIQNPVTKKWQEVINVKFVEEGNRSGGASSSMSNTSDVLSRAVGVKTGLSLLRIHTHPVLVEAIDQFPVGREFPNHFINRKMYSLAQMEQQINVAPRMIDGKPTYFITEIAEIELPDEDLRMADSQLVVINPALYRNARVGATIVESISQFETEGTLRTSRLAASE